MDWLTENKIPLGAWIKSLVEFLNDNAAWFFDFISDVLGFTINGLIDVLQWLPPLLLVAIFAALAYGLHRSWRLALMVAGSLLLIVNLGYWEQTIETLALVVFATFL
ncbi:MAG: choline ABC transporter permease subunit, partial [Proteobacteria bacterium]|nr:choline ABC transporter permease subunit [Pseudomonadota bacterium]